MYEILKLDNSKVVLFSDFIENLHKNYWALTSNAYQREPPKKIVIDQHTILKDIKDYDIYFLHCGNQIISAMRITRKQTDSSIVIFSHVETHPDYQKRGIFGLALGDACLRKACESEECKRVELTTWSFNRKGIPFYKRGGFRAVPGTNLLMENYLPSIVKHPDARPYFDRYDYIRTLQNERSYGYDAVDVDGVSVFEYCWKPRKTDDTLRVLVDWQKKEIVRVECILVDSSLLVEETDHV